MRTIRTVSARKRFLDQVALTMNVTSSARAAGFSRRAAYEWRNDDPEFAKDWDDAIETAIDRAEAEAVRRAVEGIAKPLMYIAKPLMYQGAKVGEVQEYSDRLLEFILRGRRPKVYGDKVENTLALSDPLQRIVDEIASRGRSIRTIEHED
jgi:hypothetical protein